MEMSRRLGGADSVALGWQAGPSRRRITEAANPKDAAESARLLLSTRSSLDSELFHLAAQGRTVDAQDLCGLAAVAVAVLQRL